MGKRGGLRTNTANVILCALFPHTKMYCLYNFHFLSFRVVYIFGPPVKEPPTDVTPTFLTTGVLSTLRQADFEAHNILRESGKLPILFVTTCFS